MTVKKVWFHNYILDDDGNPLPVDDMIGWAKWFADAGDRRIVQQDTLENDVLVSTVFLGMDHSLLEGEPVLWGTMIFGGGNDQYQMRYTSRELALEGHKKALEMVKNEPKRRFRDK